MRRNIYCSGTNLLLGLNSSQYRYSLLRSTWQHFLSLLFSYRVYKNQLIGNLYALVSDSNYDGNMETSILLSVYQVGCVLVQLLGIFSPPLPQYLFYIVLQSWFHQTSHHLILHICHSVLSSDTLYITLFLELYVSYFYIHPFSLNDEISWHLSQG